MSQGNIQTQVIRVGIHTVPPDQHGWRGLELEGNRKRKWYTLLENEQCLVTALLIPPGEIGVRHSHETGELNIHFANGLPLVRWNAPGELHGGYSPTAPVDDPEQAQRLNDAEATIRAAGLDAVANVFRDLASDVAGFRKLVEELARPAPSLNVGIDVLFPPFKTTIDDPTVPGGPRTVIGQWYD
ncbi:MAG: hypothetical protein OXN15_05660 [Chloroflexota bacterium]|nr:hypothetical protein [Chloroflexota bacterium]MDE2900497.1 hypothetical protein [Chloroflexota bacterium]MDE2970080.1 hypothetical protein [Chloroflexota bacterium]